MRPLLLTGASGFVGRRLVDRLAAAGELDLRLVDQRPLPDGLALSPGWSTFTGDLRFSGEWTKGLEGADTVLHLAALTGKADRRTHFAANLEATRVLVDSARRHRVRRFLFVSTIAARYEDRRHYHYAEAKRQAEAVVQASGMETLVVRPTMVLGPGSPVLANLSRLARLPVPVMFGRGREVQPVHVDDLVEVLFDLLRLDRWTVGALEVGGPEVLPMELLIARLRAEGGLPPRRPLRIPLGPARAVLGLLEPALLPLLPFTAGQLAAFANPATASGSLPPGVTPPGRDLRSMLATDPSRAA